MDTQSPEERARLAALLAQLTPAQRLEAASSLGLSPADLAALGVPVDEGDAEGDEEGGGGDDDDGAGAPGVSIRDVWDVAASRFWPRAAVVLFFGAVPLVLLLIKERRGLSLRQLFEQVARLPFTD